MGSIDHSREALNRRSKTVDIGYEGTSVSVNPTTGKILGLTTFHPKHGIVLAEPYEQFCGDKFHDAEYVRKHRTRMLDSLASSSSRGYGVSVDIGPPSMSLVEYDAMNHATIRQSFGDGIRVSMTIVVAREGQVLQRCEVDNTRDVDAAVPWAFDANMSVNRASYGQLTEGGPISLPLSENQVSHLAEYQILAVVAKHLEAHFVCAVEIDGRALSFGNSIQQQTCVGKPVRGQMKGILSIPGKTSKTLVARYCLRSGVSPKVMQAASSFPSERPSIRFWVGHETRAQFMVRRNLDYILGCCSVVIPGSREIVCMLTDHVALPLGWNRDNYWQARFLMDARQSLHKIAASQDAARYTQQIERVLRGHLTWVFDLAERPHGYWHRSYLATGKPKDGPVFQLDQQCYPFLELVDLYDMFPEQSGFVKEMLSQPVVDDFVGLVASKTDGATGLVATEETPGDDPVEFEFHFSSHVLLWHTLTRLGALLRRIEPGQSQILVRIDSMAISLRKATLAHFLQQDQQSSEWMYAYLTDGHGAFRMYHDGNDVVTLFAREWGFLESEIEMAAWENTMRFANSSRNEGGYCSNGPYAGLGSVHSPGPWPLGYYQTWRFSQVVGDHQLEQKLWKQICDVMQRDGTFPEAVDVVTGECTSKAWFSWPGSMIGSGLLRQENRGKYLEASSEHCIDC